MTTEGTARAHSDSAPGEPPRQRGADDLSWILSTISHEIKNPLASLKLNGQMIARAIERGATPRLESARLLQSALDQLNQVASELSEAARFDGPQPALTLAPTDVVALVRASAAEAEATYQRPIATDLPSQPLLAVADAGVIHQALGYLLDNAARYTPASGAITLRVRRSGARARIEVCDAGPGIAPHERTRLFDAFARGETPAQPHVPPGAGLGLGLYIARRIVQRHGGDIGVESSPTATDTATAHDEAGAVFWLALPLAPVS